MWEGSCRRLSGGLRERPLPSEYDMWTSRVRPQLIYARAGRQNVPNFDAKGFLSRNRFLKPIVDVIAALTVVLWIVITAFGYHSGWLWLAGILGILYFHTIGDDTKGSPSRAAGRSSMDAGRSLAEDGQIICPHCQTRGRVRTYGMERKTGISGAKATAAIITAGLSLFFVGLSRKDDVLRARCSNCNVSWDIS